MKATVVSAAAELPVQSVTVMADIDCFAEGDYSVAANCKSARMAAAGKQPALGGQRAKRANIKMHIVFDEAKMPCYSGVLR